MKDPKNELHVEPGEKHLLLDHSYDGIQELNHPLPSWWNYIFYAAIVYSMGYFAYYQFLGGKSLKEDFQETYAQVLISREEFKKLHSGFKIESYQAVANMEGIKKGKEIFENNCLPCHGPEGRGDIGPNLTDEYWLIAKGTPESIFNVVFNGSEANGMPPWAEILTAEEIYLAVSYVMTLKNTHAKEGKAPQGQKIEE